MKKITVYKWIISCGALNGAPYLTDMYYETHAQVVESLKGEDVIEVHGCAGWTKLEVLV